MERNPNEKHTTVSDVDVLPLNGLHKEDVNKEASEGKMVYHKNDIHLRCFMCHSV